MYVKRTNQTLEDLYQRILSHHGELFAKFTLRYISTGDDRLLWLLVLDRCSILQVLETYNNSGAGQELNISLVKLVQVHQDLLILDNQIPFQALRLLCDDEARLKKCLKNFLDIHGIKDRGNDKGNKGTHNGPVEHTVNVLGDDEKQSIEDDPVHNEQQSIEDDDPIHLLDYLWRAFLKRDLVQSHKEVKFERKDLHVGKYRIGTIRELKAAGIHVKKDPNNTIFYPSFSDGILYLPKLTVDGSMTLIFLNLIAYEMCLDFPNDLLITSYVVFMSSLITQPEDVKELISADILINKLANDKQMVDLFNKMDSVLVPEMQRYAEIRDRIRNHFCTRTYNLLY